jgi:hypothetical protein
LEDEDEMRIMNGLIVFLLLLAGTLQAEARPEDPKIAGARQRYESGLAHFNLQEYGPAIEDFEAAYRLKPDPVFLYNLAQAHRLADHPDRALYFYRAYLHNSESVPNRREVEERIASLEALIAEKKTVAKPPDHTLPPSDAKPEPAPAPIVAAPVKPVAEPAPVVRSEKHTPVYKRWWLWTVVGGVAAGVALGVGLGVGLSSRATFDAGLGTVGPAALRGGL